jgi:tripartite-type tricarboxylate transporter receptor subunit TctC
MIFASTASAVLFVPACVAFAQTYPAKPIRIVVPHTAGGATDLIVCLLVNFLVEKFN